MAENIKKEYVIDASFVLSFLLPDESNKDTAYLFRSYGKGEIDFVSTYLLPFEVLNGIKTAVKRKRLSKNIALELIKEFLQFEITLEKIDLYQAFLLSQQRNLTLYDASYVYLAKVKSLSLLTLDKALKQ